MKLAIKAVGEWTLDVLAIPFGSPSDRDGHDQYFDADTNLHRERFPTPAVHYYHGMTPEDAGIPEEIGQVKSSQIRSDGVWYRVVLNRASKFAKLVMDAAKKGLARASSGTAAHLARYAPDGHITSWPVVEISLMDTGGRLNLQPANKRAVAIPVLKSLGISYPDNLSEDITMDKDELLELLDERDKEKELESKSREERAAAIKAAERRRLPFKEKNVKFLEYSELSKFDNLDAGDQALLVGILNSNPEIDPPSENAVKALAVKLSEDKTRVGVMGQYAMKALGIKSDEVMQQDLSGYGDEWVGVAYSQAIWDAIRVGTFVAEKIPSIEIPQGQESIFLPLEDADPTYYKVAETTDHDATMLFPVASVTSSKVKTGRQQITLAKMGCRVPWSGELGEDSLIPFVDAVRRQIQKAGAEQLEHAIIDGDTETGATTNINDIAGTPAASDLFMMFDGFRKSCLVTTTANSRDGGVLTITDFLETLKLMGTAGINALDHGAVGFVTDVNTHWKALELAETKTKDVFSRPTLESGRLVGIYGYSVHVSPNMHFKSTARKANAAGKVDVDAQGNNTKGAILAVRWDQWKLGYRRRMTIETTRYPRSDSWEMVALMRLGLVQRDTESSAISYNLTI